MLEMTVNDVEDYSVKADCDTPFNESGQSSVLYSSDGPQLASFEVSTWVSRLLEEFGLEEPPPSAPERQHINVLPIEISQTNKPSLRARSNLPSHRFLKERPPRLKPSCCLKKKAALTRASKVKSVHRKSLQFSAGDAPVCRRPHRVRNRAQDVLEHRPTELFEVISLSDVESNHSATESGTIDAPVWLSRQTLKFHPCRSYEEGRQFFYMANQTSSPLEFAFTVVGDPRIHGVENQPPKVPNQTEILQEKPFFKQAKMKFDPVSYSVGPILGSQNLPFTASWLQSYRQYRQTDNYPGTSAIPISTAEFIAGVSNSSDEASTNTDSYQQTVARCFTVEPWSGTLAPLESVLVCVRFQPWFLTTVHAQLVLTCSAQPEAQTLYLIGPCARVNVEIRPKYVDLGACLYDAMLERTIKITNHGRYQATFSIDGAVRLTKNNLLKPDFDAVYASLINGKVRPKEELPVNIYFVPGSPGKFIKHFYVRAEGQIAVQVVIRGRAVYQSVDIDLPRRVPTGAANRPKKTKMARNNTATVKAELGDLKQALSTQESTLTRWAERSRHKAKASNIRRNSVFNVAFEFRPFEGILDFAKLPAYLLDFGLHGPASPPVVRRVHVLNSGTQAVTFRLTQAPINDKLRRKISVNFNRHNHVRPDHSETITFSIDPRDYVLGPSECPVLFTIVNGPTFTITCRIQIDEPQLDVRLRCAKVDGDCDVYGCRIIQAKPLDSGSRVSRVPTLDFGTVRCGYLSTTYVQLVNSGHVPCTWKAGEVDIDLLKQGKHLPPKERLQLKYSRKDHRVFRLYPPQCTLQPGQRINLEIWFHPVDDLEYNFLWPIEVDFSKQRTVIRARGRGVRPRVEFSSTELSFGCILPYLAGQEKSLTIYNPCPFPLEVYCKELDKQHVYEEEMISHVEEFDRETEVRFPVRRIGGTIQERIIESYRNHFATSPPFLTEHDKAALLGSPPLENFGTETGRPESSQISEPGSNLLDEQELPPHLKSRFPKQTSANQYKKKFTSKREMYQALRGIVQTPLGNAIAENRGVNMTADNRKEQFKKGVVFLIHGPPSCGKTTLASLFGKYYKIPLLTIDKIIMDAIQAPTERIHHRVLNYIQNPAAMAQQPFYGPGTARSLQTPPDQDGKSREKSKVPSMKLIAKSFKPPSHNKGPPGTQMDPNAQRDRLDPDLAFQPKQLVYQNYLTDKQSELTTCPIPEDILSQLISARLYKQDCRRGAVFDGLQSDFLDACPSAARAILSALENRKRIYSYVLCSSFRDYRKRRQRQRIKRKNDNYATLFRQMAAMRNLSENEYRVLRRTARKKVDSTIAEYVAAMRAMRRQVKLSLTKPEIVPVVEHHSLQPTKAAKLAASSQKLPAVGEDVSVDLTKKTSHKSDGHSSDAISLATGTKITPRNTVSARVSIAKGKGKQTGSTALGGKDGRSEKSKRDSWDMLPKIRKDGSVSGIYRTELYRRHKLFYTTLKEYTTVMTKWTGCPKQEAKRTMRSEAMKDQLPAVAKKRTIKSKDAKSKPKEVSDAERAARDKAAIERVKGRCRKRRGFGVKHCMVMRRGTQLSDNGLINFLGISGRWRHLPYYAVIEEGTTLRVPIPKSEVFAMIKKHPAIVPIQEDSAEPHFRFVVGLDETALSGAIPTPLLAAHHSTHVIPPPVATPERVVSPRETTERASRLDVKQDRTKTAKSAVNQRAIGSAMPHDISHASAKEEKAAVPVDYSVVYPSFNRAKALSEPKSKAIGFFRWALQAYDTVTLRLLFQSNEEGKFQQKYTFRIVDYCDDEFGVTVRGTCQYTNLFANLASIFPPAIWVEKITEDRLAPVYVEGDRKLYFGPLLAGKKKADILADKSPQNVYSFVIKNHYKRTLNVHFNILKHQGSNPKDKTSSVAEFSVVPDSFVIRGKEEQTVKFYAHPVATGRCEDTVLAFTEYNPVPTQITLSALSVKPQAEVLTKNVVIEKVPIREISTGNIEVRNKSPLIPVRWRLIGVDQLPPEFVFDAREGTLKPSAEVQVIPVRFISTSDRPVVHVKKGLRIEFSSEDPDLGATQTEGLTISGESYDLILDITFPKVLDSVLDFGICKVNDEIMRQMTIRNKSKSDCGFQLIAVYEDLPSGQFQPEKLHNFLDFQPSSGALTSMDRPITVNVICKPKFEIELKQKKIVKCLVVDPARANMRVAEIPIKTNICAKYSKFVLSPPIGEVRFPCTLPMQKRTRILTIQNVGDYELVYVIKKIASSSQPTANQFNPTPISSKKDGITPAGPTHSPLNNALIQKASTASTHISRKTDQTNVTSGVLAVPFVIRPLTGVVKVGDTAQITVEFGSDVIGTHEETHSIDITDRDISKHPQGIVYTFSGEIAIPAFDVKNTNQIFSEHLILPPDSAVSETALEKWLVDRSVYAPKRRQFYVQHTFVGAKRQLRFKLSNTANIHCPISVTLKPAVATVTAGKTTAKPSADGFSIAGGSSVIIEPHQSIHVIVVFAPTLAIKYQAILDITIESQTVPAARTTGLNFEVFAEAVLPSLRILHPVQKDRRGQLCLYYPKGAVGESQTLPVRLLNDTVLPVTVALHIRNAEGVFEIVPDSGDEHRFNKEIMFSPKEEREIAVKFAPTYAGRFRKYFEISCLDAISPDIFVLLKADAVTENVEFTGLPALPYDERLRLTSGTGNQVDDVVMERYQLYFGDCKPGQSLSYKFEVSNPTPTWLRFEWMKLPDMLDIVPRAGHIKPQSQLEIEARLNLPDDSQTRLLTAQCSLSGIIVPETCDSEHVWTSEKPSLQVLADVRKARLDSDILSMAHSADKLDTDRDSDHSVKEGGGKHDKKELGKKLVDAKKSKEKKPVGKKDSLTDKHRKTTDKVEKTKRKPSETKKDGEHGKRSGMPAGSHKEPLTARLQCETSKTAESPRNTLSTGAFKADPVPADDSSLQQKIMAPTPEPAFTVKPGSSRTIPLVVSAIVGYAKFECSHQEILFKDTFVLERRKACFTVKNTGNIAIRFTTAFSSSPEACLAYLQQAALVNSTRALLAQEKEKPEKDKRGKVEASVEDETAAPVAVPVRAEKPAKHTGSPRTPATSSTTEAPAGRETQKKKRKMSRDSTDIPQTQQQVSPSPKSTGLTNKIPQPAPAPPVNTRQLDAKRFQALSAVQTADLRFAFNATPAEWTIKPLSSQVFVVEFHPGEPLEYLGCLFFQVENLDTRSLPLAVPIHGVAKLPLLHLSTATETNLRWNEIPNQEDRILDFNCIGTDEPMTQQLVLTNPTNTDYQFTLACLDHEDAKKAPFEVSKAFGLVAAGKRTMVDVTFVPHCFGMTESKWLIQLPAHGVVLPLTFSAKVKEPEVSLTPAVVAFRPLLSKMRKTKYVYLTNNETIALKFEMDMENFKGYEQITWEIVPMNGVIPGKTKREIAITVSPNREFTADLLLLCRVQKCHQPLRAMIEHEILAPSVELIHLRDSDRLALKDDSSDSPIIDFGHTDACSVYRKNFQLTNTGPINVAYTIKLLSTTEKTRPGEKSYLTLSNTEGLIAQGKVVMLVLTYAPRSLKDTLTNLHVVIQVEFGPRFDLTLRSALSSVDIDFSFDECDFGPVLILRDSPDLGRTVPLIIANPTGRKISLDLVNYALPSSMAFEFAPLTLEPGNSTIHTVMFLPTDPEPCFGTLTFLINESITKTVTLKGEGVEMHLEVAARMRYLQFNRCVMGKRSTVVLEVWNRSKVEVTGRVVLQNRTSSPQLKTLLDDKTLFVTPGKDMVIPPQKSLKVNINFKPASRTLNFESRVCFLTDQNVERELSTLTGSCDGLDVVLQERLVDFGALVLHGTLRRTIVMKNVGEIGGHYAWDAAHLTGHFSIKPQKGYIPAKDEVVFEVTFAPNMLNAEIKAKDVECTLPGNRAPIQLSLMGSCVSLPQPKETVTFECPVRHFDTKSLQITNTTPSPWQLKPVVSNDRWTVPALVSLKANTTESFDVVFRPLECGSQQAVVSLVLPTGQAVVYNLHGKTQPPKPNGKITRDVPCRTEHRETLMLLNWLPKVQAFKVIFEYVKPDKPDASIELTGKSVIHIPASAQMDYELTFKALRDKDVNAVYVCRVVFKSEETGEYQYYDVQYKVTKGPAFDAKTTTSQVRKLRRESIKIRNPLDSQVSMACSLQGVSSEVSLEPMTLLTVGGKKEAEIFVDFFPLRAGTSVGRIDIVSPELGAFYIELSLQATAGPHEPPIVFDCLLGSTTTQTCKLCNYSKSKADFAVKITEGASEFQLLSDRSIYSLQPGSTANPSEHMVEVQCDPSQLGEFRGRLVATSPTAGEFQYVFVCNCIRPKPKGPYVITQNGELVPPLEFKNPFLRPCTFNLVSSCRAFQVKEFTDVVKGKKTVNLPVTFAPNNIEGGLSRGTSVVGQVTVTPKSDGPLPAEENTEWIYYVKAES